MSECTLYWITNPVLLDIQELRDTLTNGVPAHHNESVLMKHVVTDL